MNAVPLSTPMALNAPAIANATSAAATPANPVPSNGTPPSAALGMAVTFTSVGCPPSSVAVSVSGPVPKLSKSSRRR